ncbi:hypothetical protein GC105_12265 [Alkalibaculum sp. M08DMB]|uniref:Uncharacterized protein n=1 Tax=Alkalibaculum sporogenes TaxID=2655001 RepID=A0A6A7KB20_9FIRM|nr:hypothetical protein [Alkalibaculum sporogenes]MPW26562.1 hypothetical protein [Alkalibaculum sporogenes]
MKLNKINEIITLTNDKFEVHIQKKIFGGYIFKKYVLNSPFDLLETREVRLDISEDEAIDLGKEILNKIYKTNNLFSNFNVLTN